MKFNQLNSGEQFKFNDRYYKKTQRNGAISERGTFIAFKPAAPVQRVAFGNYKSMTVELQQTIDKFAPEDPSWGQCNKLQAELNGIGWDCEYGMCGTPYGLRKLGL